MSLPTVPTVPTESTVPTRPRLDPLPVERAMLLPAKLRWEVVARYRIQGSFAAATELLDAIEAVSGESATLLEERARLAYAQEDYETAIELLRQRIERQPSATAWVGLGRLYLEIGDLERAQEIASELAASNGGLMTVAAFVAEVERAAGELAAAKTRYSRILADKPNSIGTLLALAGVALDEGDRGATEHYLEEALSWLQEGGTAGQYLGAAAVAEALGDLETAKELRANAATVEASRVRALQATIAKALGDTDGLERETLWSPTAEPGGTTEREERNGRKAEPMAAPRQVPAEPEPELEPEEADAEPDVEALFPGTLDALRRLFGHEGFRRGQAAVVANVLARRDTLATMPTGAGKSLTFQLPAMLLDGVTLVISPLIALMKDQVEGLPPAVQQLTALVNSTLSAEEQRRALDGIADGRYKLVYAAPERLRQRAFLRALRAAGVGLVVIDEAHCISLWGHDFRPDYLAIPKALPELGQPPVLAITATATPAMARAIGAGLGRELDRVRVSLFRANLFYEAHRCANREEKVKQVVRICHEQRKKGEGCGIVYVSSRKDAEQIAGVLRDRGIGAIPYHAGLDPAVRARNQDQFMRGDARAQVVVATVAFGMGVDKADVRFIVHLSPARSLEAYAQESGRAGRDGKPARCVLLFAPTDQSSMKRLAKRDLPDLDELRPIFAAIKRATVGRWAILDPGSLLPPPGPDEDPEEAVDPRVAIGIFEEAGLVYRHPDAPVSRILRPLANPSSPAEPLSPEDADALARLTAWAGLEAGRRAGSVIQTAEACAALDLTPGDLERLLGAQGEYAVREERRAVCLELLPAGGDAAAKLRQVLERAKIEANRRIDQVIAYANGHACRHATLAAHLGERLAPCRVACDVCTGTENDGASAGGASAARSQPPKRAAVTAADARAVLEAVRTLPFPMGKTGLTKLLLGSVESRVRADRSNAFGALEHLPKARVEELIDRMVEDGLLDRDLSHEFKVIRLTRLGAAATDDILEAYATPVRIAAALAPVARGADDADGEEELDEAGAALYQRLVDWRRQHAVAQGISAFIVAHNRTLRAIARVRPRTLDELAQLPGFGANRVEKYGEELLEIVGEAS